MPASEFSKQTKKAKEICPDPDDTEYFALALQLNCPLWSNDKKLKNQQEIRVINTIELLKKPQ
jgi:predicted nucleic acid-binding protein